MLTALQNITFTTPNSSNINTDIIRNGNTLELTFTIDHNTMQQNIISAKNKNDENIEIFDICKILNFLRPLGPGLPVGLNRRRSSKHQF